MMNLILEPYLRYHLGESSEDEEEDDQITITYLQRDYIFDKKLYDLYKIYLHPYVI